MSAIFKGIHKWFFCWLIAQLSQLHFSFSHHFSKQTSAPFVLQLWHNKTIWKNIKFKRSRKTQKEARCLKQANHQTTRGMNPGPEATVQSARSFHHLSQRSSSASADCFRSHSSPKITVVRTKPCDSRLFIITDDQCPHSEGLLKSPSAQCDNRRPLKNTLGSEDQNPWMTKVLLCFASQSERHLIFTKAWLCMLCNPSEDLLMKKTFRTTIWLDKKEKV